MMTVLLKILSVIGIILLIFIALIMWVILVPRNFWVEYSKRDGLIAKMNVAFFKVTLYPLPRFLNKKRDDIAEKAEKAEREKNSGENSGNTSFAENIQFSFDLVKQVLSAAKGIIKRIFKALKFRDVSFTAPVYAGDIHSTQKAYGAVTSAFYSLNIFLQQYVQIYYKSPVFVADFANSYGDAVYFYCKITASPAMILSAAYFAYKQYVAIIRANTATTAQQKKEIKNG